MDCEIDQSTKKMRQGMILTSTFRQRFEAPLRSLFGTGLSCICEAMLQAGTLSKVLVEGGEVGEARVRVKES